MNPILAEFKKRGWQEDKVILEKKIRNYVRYMVDGIGVLKGKGGNFKEVV